MDKRQRDQNNQDGNKQHYNQRRTVSKELLIMMIIMNAMLGLFLKSWGNALVAIIISFILFLYINPGKYLRIKNILREFSLANTWMLMRILMTLSWTKTHPWKKNPPSYRSWLNGSTILNEDFSYIITLMFTVIIPLIVYGVLSKYDIL